MLGHLLQAQNILSHLLQAQNMSSHLLQALNMLTHLLQALNMLSHLLQAQNMLSHLLQAQNMSSHLLQAQNMFIHLLQSAHTESPDTCTAHVKSSILTRSFQKCLVWSYFSFLHTVLVMLSTYTPDIYSTWHSQLTCLTLRYNSTSFLIR